MQRGPGPRVAAALVVLALGGHAAAESDPEARREAAERQRLGGDAYAREAAALSDLMLTADERPHDAVERQALALANTRWPGAAEALLFLAEWERRHARYDAALARYAEVEMRWPGTEAAHVAQRGGAGAALAKEDWDDAETRARALPAVERGDVILRDELIAAAQRGRSREAWMGRCGLAFALVLLGLAASLADACLRGGRRWPSLLPPTEVMFLGPIAVVLVVAAFTTHELIAPAVLTVSVGGVVLSYLSGITLDTLRKHGRSLRLRALLHALACVVGVGALLYIALMRHQLLDLVLETMEFGPGG